MNIFVRIGKLLLTFAIFIVAQALLAASINSMFELVPIRIERLFPKDPATVAATAKSEDASLVGKVKADVNRVENDLRDVKVQRRKEKHLVPTMLTGSMTSTAVMDSSGGALATSATTH